MFDWKEQFVNHSLEEAVIKAVKVYGIEGAEDKAKNILSQMPEFQKRFLETLYKLYNFGEKNG